MIFSCQHIPIWVTCTNPNADMLIKKVWWQHVDIVEEHLQQIRIKNNIISFIQHIERRRVYSSVYMHPSVLIYIHTSSKKGLFPLLMRVLWVSPQTFIFTTGFMLFPGNWRPSMIRTRILIMEGKSDHLRISCLVPFDFSLGKNWTEATLMLNGTNLEIKSFLRHGVEATVPGSPAVCWIKAAVFWPST